jgi:hypothetical protein
VNALLRELLALRVGVHPNPVGTESRANAFVVYVQGDDFGFWRWHVAINAILNDCITYFGVGYGELDGGLKKFITLPIHAKLDSRWPWCLNPE